jgi:hypothetical protein
MVNDNLNKIFLSASIPSPARDKRDKKYYDTADILAIRDAVRALATVVIPKAHLVWGGHPSITPLIRFVMDRMSVNVKDHVTLYQSLYYEKFFPEDNFAFENIVQTEKTDNREESLLIMRKRMIEENNFKAGIFIGGMEGIEDEFKLFSTAHSSAIVLPIASTGAGAKIVFDKYKEGKNFDDRLLKDYAYMALFRDFIFNH